MGKDTAVNIEGKSSVFPGLDSFSRAGDELEKWKRGKHFPRRVLVAPVDEKLKNGKRDPPPPRHGLEWKKKYLCLSFFFRVTAAQTCKINSYISVNDFSPRLHLHHAFEVQKVAKGSAAVIQVKTNTPSI